MKSRDEILVDGLRSGDRGAQCELYERYSASLMAISLRYMGERAAAEDLLHDTFIKIFGSIGSFRYRGEGSLRAWMSRIVVNAALGQLRSRGRQQMIPLDEHRELREQEEIPPDVARVPREVLLRFIAELPDGYRQVFNLYCIEGYSHRQIAQSLDINEKSSSSQLLRARRLLIKKVKSYTKLHE
ncbi:MAG: RNA polymerase sigma factor [Rikenellaceae bacterium]